MLSRDGPAVYKTLVSHIASQALAPGKRYALRVAGLEVSGIVECIALSVNGADYDGGQSVTVEFTNGSSIEVGGRGRSLSLRVCPELQLGFG